MYENMTLEEQLLTATEIDPSRYKTRQKLLTAIVKVVDKLPEDKYQGLTDPALDWFQDAVKALKKKSSVPEFPDAYDEAAPPRDPIEEPDEEADPDEEGEPEDDEEAEDEEATLETAADGTGLEGEAAEPEAAEAEVAEPEPAPPKRGRGRPKKPPQPPKPRKQDPIGTPTRYAKLTGNKNRYGIYEGTKLDEVCGMLEKGATQAEIKEQVGDTKYNLVRRLIAEGHHVEHVGNKFTLTHKDDVKDEAKPKGKKK